MRGLKFLCFLPVFVFTACQSFNSTIQEPVVSLKSINIAGISVSGVDLIAHVDVENPNGFSVPLPKIDWELFVNAASFIQGTLKDDKSIKGREKATMALPLNIAYDELYRSTTSLIEAKEAAYNIALGVTFPVSALENKVYHLDFTGVLPLPQLPKLSPGQMRVSKIDFAGAELAWDINVENPNGFSIPFPKLNWDYGVSGVSVLKSSLGGAGVIAANAAGAALINVSVPYADVFRVVDSSRSSGEVSSNLSVDIDSSEGYPLVLLEGIKNMLEVPGTLPILQKPEVSFQGITRKSLGTTMEFFLNWEVNNRNNFSFDIGGFDYDFMVNNSHWAGGRVENLPRLRANGRTIIPLTIAISTPAIVREVVDIINRGSNIAYNCTGNMSLLGSFPGLDEIELPLDLQGNTRILTP